MSISGSSFLAISSSMRASWFPIASPDTSGKSDLGFKCGLGFRPGRQLVPIWIDEMKAATISNLKKLAP